MPELNVANVGLASLPVFILIIFSLRWNAPKAGAVACLAAVVLSLILFGADTGLIGVASSKGLSLSLFVLSIIWTSVLLYNVVDRLKGINVIGHTMTRLVRDPLGQALIVGWCFSGFMQGVAGFGVPVAVVAPLLVLMGFSPARAAAIVLIGHSWAVTFGSLGSSYYTIQLVTRIEGDVIGPHMAALFVLPTVLTGFAIAQLQGGLASVRRGALAILVIGGAMSATVWILAAIGVPQIASIVAGLLGCAIGGGLTRTPLLRSGVDNPADGGWSKAALPIGHPGVHMAFLPYYLIVLLSIFSQFPVVKEFGSDLFWGLDYPATKTALGFEVESEEAYAKIRLLRHPAPLILVSLAVTLIVFRVRGLWRPGGLFQALKSTYGQCVPASVAIMLMVMMALVMTDTGMTALLSRAIANGTGAAFPVFSPYIGVLGTFMTGSNTNSNVMFGALQIETASALRIESVTIASVQSIGGSLGSAIAPAKVLIGTAIVGLSGREREVLRRTIPYTLGIAFIVGVQAWVVLKLF